MQIRSSKSDVVWSYIGIIMSMASNFLLLPFLMKYVDSEAKLRQKVGQTYVEFETDKLIDVTYEELDIARVIKLAKDYYHIEIIPRGIEEYTLWDKLCTNNFRGSSRQYGLM